ncbi:M15 family metallopeptidase [Agromyces albus]|uniref:Peptidase M15 n=1 Tax=Agromyces albus TaxID=205332 RepID=A0A4Q2L2P4_9MICO|nr:M15 family metallopeptidase [Agromyces albus]RXZ72384.1 peptidase M15 [Agromyces albus]
MNRNRRPQRTAARGVRGLLVVGALVIVIAATTAAISSTLPSSSSAAPSLTFSDAPAPPRSEDRGVLDETGRVGDGVTVFDDGIPALTNLDPVLLEALRQAATDAASDGVVFVLNSGWRSPEYQDQLLREAISEYGSLDEAARWVATAATSPHVSGDAVDIGHVDATAWLSEHGAEYGLCQIYDNEPWHYELRPEAIEHGCPATYADPTQDPRMQQ